MLLAEEDLRVRLRREGLARRDRSVSGPTGGWETAMRGSAIGGEGDPGSFRRIGNGCWGIRNERDESRSGSGSGAARRTGAPPLPPEPAGGASRRPGDRTRDRFDTVPARVLVGGREPGRDPPGRDPRNPEGAGPLPYVNAVRGDRERPAFEIMGRPPHAEDLHLPHGPVANPFPGKAELPAG